MEYEVVYKITIHAKSPLQAALEIEKWLNNLIYRPCLEVTNLKTNKKTIIDLEERKINA
jgi:hypothetical protein